MSILDYLLGGYLRSRLQIPSADLPVVAAQSADYTANGQPLTVDEVQAGNKATIDYVLGRIVRQVTPKV